MLPDIWEISRESAGKIDDTLYASYYPVAMTVIDSYRDTAGSVKLINNSINQYRDVYKSMGMDVK